MVSSKKETVVVHMSFSLDRQLTKDETKAFNYECLVDSLHLFLTSSYDLNYFFNLYVTM